MSEAINVYEVVRKLIGPIYPVGETHTDDKRFENLKEMTALIEDLVQDLFGLDAERASHQFSVKRAADYASDFVKNLVPDKEATDD